MSSYNEGAQIVPIEVVQSILREIAGINAIVPDNYARVQLLTNDSYRDIVFKNYDRSYIQYAADSKDFPLCADFCKICSGNVLEGAIKAGLSVRPCFGDLYYTKKSGGRHAIQYLIIAISYNVSYYEPQTDEWLNTPKDCLTMDEFKL